MGEYFQPLISKAQANLIPLRVYKDTDNTNLWVVQHVSIRNAFSRSCETLYS